VAKIEEPGLLGVQRQPEPLESLREDRQDPPRIRLMLEDEHEVVGVAHERRATAKARPDLSLEPAVEDLVEVDVRQDGRDDSALRRAGGRRVVRAALHYARIQPLADRAHEDAVVHPLAEDLSRVRMVQDIAWRFSSRFAEKSSAVCPSTPVAPPLRVRRYASRMKSTSMWCARVRRGAPWIVLDSVAIR